jgi:excisionase family DNA binding protein
MLTILAKFVLYCGFSPMVKRETDILTILEVAAYLKVAQRTVYRLAAAKKIPAFKVGGVWRFSRAEIDDWIKQQSMEGIDSIPKPGGS